MCSDCAHGVLTGTVRIASGPDSQLGDCANANRPASPLISGFVALGPQISESDNPVQGDSDNGVVGGKF